MDRPICDLNVNEIMRKSVVQVKCCARLNDRSFRVTCSAWVQPKIYRLGVMTLARLRVPAGGQSRVGSCVTCDFNSTIFGTAILRHLTKFVARNLHSKA